MIDKNTRIRQLQLGASNLIGDDTWRTLFKTIGPQLQSLKLSELNDSFNDEIVEEMAQHCRLLQRLKLRTCLKLREPSLTLISRMTTLEHLTLAVGQDASSETLVALIQNLGPSLQTLCLETYAEADDDVLVAIHTNCSKLSKLRLTGSIVCSDGGFANLFSNWRNPPMPYVDLSDNRDLDNANPEGPAEAPIGLGSEGFKALMKHSGSRLERLNVHSCRHISHEALSDVFDGRLQYPLLKDIDLSFVTVVDDFIMTGIFKSCPNLTKLAVFACFKARDARIPAGVAVIGLPNAQDAVVIEGDVVGEL
jgi:DNA repair protein RAD7